MIVSIERVGVVYKSQRQGPALFREPVYDFSCESRFHKQQKCLLVRLLIGKLIIRKIFVHLKLINTRT